MGFQNFMNTVRQWDNKTAKWMTRHFYLLFFEAFLVLIFVGLFIITIRAIDISVEVSPDSIIERLMMLQSFNSILIILLLLLNSFWMLYVFNSILRIRGLLRELNFNLTRKFFK